MRVFLYIYVYIYTVHNLWGQALPQTDKHCAPHFSILFPQTIIIYITYIVRLGHALLQGDWPWVTRQTQYPVLQYWESACTYIITYVGFSSTHRHDICRLYNSLITCLSHRPRFFFHSFAIYFMTNLLKSSNFMLNWPYFI